MTVDQRFPFSVVFEGALYLPTLKTGTHIATGQPSAEYEAVDKPGARVWIREDRTIERD